MEHSDGNGKPEWGKSAFLLVPNLENQTHWKHTVRGGSAIVGFLNRAMPSEFVIYYEGNIHDLSDLNNFKARALKAYDRMCLNHETIAMSMVEAEDFEIVGNINPSYFELYESQALKEWIALDPRLDQS